MPIILTSGGRSVRKETLCLKRYMQRPFEGKTELLSVKQPEIMFLGRVGGRDRVFRTDTYTLLY